LAPSPGSAQSAGSEFQVKISGYSNLTLGALEGGHGDDRAGRFGFLSEGEVEVTPQFRTSDGTAFALRAALNGTALTGRYDVPQRLSIPEVSAFAIGSFGRIEIGERAGFPQSLVGFTPSEIAFTVAEFGPESGARLDPNGRLPTTFLDPAVAGRIDALTYLGYAARFYDDRSPKIIYVSPRFEGGFYGALSYTPRTVEPNGFNLAERGGGGGSSRFGSAANLGEFEHVVQSALVYNRRTETLDLSVGATFSHASTGKNAPAFLRDLDTNSLSVGVSATLNDTWVLGASLTYDGFSPERADLAPNLRSVPFGVVASLNYVAGPWIFGGYYQHSEAASRTVEPRRDRVDIGEVGISYFLDHDHDLVGAGVYTDLKLYASVYHYSFQSDGADGSGDRSEGTVFLAGVRFSFF
jgi:hypothetical protein